MVYFLSVRTNSSILSLEELPVETLSEYFLLAAEKAQKEADEAKKRSRKRH